MFYMKMKNIFFLKIDAIFVTIYFIYIFQSLHFIVIYWILLDM